MTTRTVRRWSEEAHEALQGCFEITDWPALCEPHGEDIDGLTECITDYINFCVDCNGSLRTLRPSLMKRKERSERATVMR